MVWVDHAARVGDQLYDAPIWIAPLCHEGGRPIRYNDARDLPFGNSIYRLFIAARRIADRISTHRNVAARRGLAGILSPQQ